MTSAIDVVTDRPDTTAISAEASAIVLAASTFLVDSEESYRLAVNFGRGIKALQKRISEFFDPHKRRAKAMHAGLCEEEKSQLAPTEEAEQIMKKKMLGYQVECARLQRQEQERLEAQQRKLNEDRQIAEAIDLEEQGDIAGADAALNEVAPLPYVPLALRFAPPKVAGAASTKRWTFDRGSVDVAPIIKHIAGIPQDQPLVHPEIVNLLALDAKTAQQLVTAMKGSFNVPGVRAFEADGLSLSAK